MQDRRALLIPALIILSGAGLVAIGLSVAFSAWRTYLRGRDPSTHTRPQPVRTPAVHSMWAGVLCVAGCVLSGVGVVLALRIVG